MTSGSARKVNDLIRKVPKSEEGLKQGEETVKVGKARKRSSQGNKLISDYYR